MEEFELQEIQPKIVLFKLPFANKKCPLILSEQGNATALYRYSNSGPFVELLDPLSINLLPALKFSIIQGDFCIFNFGIIENLDLIPPMLEQLKERCSQIHEDLYKHIIDNTLMKQSFDSLLNIIPFDPHTELVSEIYEKSKTTFRIVFFAQTNDLPTIKNRSNDPILSLFHCICIKS
ncbi:unnamed protein product [Rotaria socialis]|uniref:Uncharacterized protein n=1 Tax=Rotaria socialis TaxID=392032 RepID=A0A820FYX1_9BILA|nr:unnamed protein product [Rotaria socialis]CAF4271275.1 unnamed protein product [Rotaria socialis]